MIIFSIVLLATFVSGILYRNSTKNRTEDAKDRLIEDHRKQEQDRELDEARARNEAKRREFENKYPDLAKHK